MYRRASLTLLAFALILPVTSSALAAEIPPLLHANFPFGDRSRPIWISAEAAFDSQGNLNRDYFHTQTIHKLEQFLDDVPDPARGCISMEEEFVSWVNPPDRSTLDKAISTSELVLVARVIGKDFGFQSTLAGQLLLVEPVEAYRGEVSTTDRLYAFFPVGTFSAGPYRFCKTDHRYPDPPPEIGEQVLLLVPKFFPDEPYLYLPYESTMLVLGQDGKVRWPKVLGRAHSDLSMAQVLEQVQRLAKEEVAP
jgi:hypothetical protein